MRSVVKFGGWVVGVVIMVLDLVAYLGMPWTPDLGNPRDKWALLCISIATFAVCFAAGWRQRGQKDMDEIQSLGDQLAGRQAALENVRQKNAKLAEILDERRRQERIQTQREKEKSAELVSSLNQRISELEGENAELTARLEELNSEERRIRKEIERMSVYDKAALRGMYLRPGGRELAIDHVENPEAMPLVRKGITELSEVHVEDDGYRFVHECLTLAAHDVIRDHPELVGIDGSDVQIAKEA